MGRTFRRRRKRRIQLTRHKTETKEIEEDFAPIRRLTEWMKQQMAGKSTCRRPCVRKLAPAVFPETGRGLKAKEKIHVGDILVRIPKHLLLTADSICSAGPTYARHRHRLTCLELLAAFVMCEKLKGALSPWSPYIATLPATYTTPAFFGPTLVRTLPPDLRRKATEMLEKLGDSYIRVQPLLTELEQESPSFRGAFTYDLYKWAWSAVSTRCVHYDDGHADSRMAMAPFLDLLNHSWQARVRAGYNRVTQCYEIVSLRPYKKHEQVFINYGGHSNRSLLLHYGFVLRDNPNDIVEVTLEDVLLHGFEGKIKDQLPALLDTRLEILKSRNLLKDSIITAFDKALSALLCSSGQSQDNDVGEFKYEQQHTQTCTVTANLLRAKLHVLTDSCRHVSSFVKAGVPCAAVVEALLADEALLLQNVKL